MFLSDLNIAGKMRNFAPAFTATEQAAYEIRVRYWI